MSDLTNASRTQTPDVLLLAHSAALQLQFYDRQTFPEEYRNGAFVAFWGSWRGDRGPAAPATWGCPTGLLVHPDGSLLFTEEENGRIYRMQSQGSS